MDPIIVLGIAALVIPSITSHEAAHAFVADRLGDPTAREQGRVTLNPLPHIDPVFTILLPGFLLLSGSGIIFGGAKPVPVQVDRLRQPRRDWALVGAAGPLMNLLLAIAFSALLALLYHSGAVTEDAVLTEILAAGIFVNVLLCVFNLLPIPPLDGSRIVQNFLSGEALAAYQKLEKYGLLLIVALLIFFPPMQRLLAELVRDLTMAVTYPLGVTSTVEHGLRNLGR